MNKIDLVIADGELDYLNRFIRYFRNSEYRQVFVVKAFTDAELFTEYMRNYSGLGIICYTAEYEKHLLDHNQNFLKLLLSDGYVGDQDSIDNRVLSKLQPLDTLLATIYSIFLRENPYVSSTTALNRTKTISIQSVTPGFYKNEFSISLSRFLAGEGFKVFYLNLEQYNASEHFLGAASKFDLSKIIYHLKKDPNKLSAYIERYKSKSSYYNLDYFERARNVSELDELEPADINVLLTSIKSLSIYDYLIVECDLTINAQAAFRIEPSDHLLLLVENSAYENIKLRQIRNHLDFIKHSEKHNQLDMIRYILINHEGTHPSRQAVDSQDFIGYVESEQVTGSERASNLERYFYGLELFLKDLSK